MLSRGATPKQALIGPAEKKPDVGRPSCAIWVILARLRPTNLPNSARDADFSFGGAFFGLFCIFVYLFSRFENVLLPLQRNILTVAIHPLLDACVVTKNALALARERNCSWISE